MTENVYIQFLKPGDGIEIIFFLVLLLLTVGTLLATFIFAKPKYWEKSWDNDTETDLDDLDAQHGSVYDLSDAVATKPENLAIVLPGVLLVIGLLGTFFGVGVSLNQATEVLYLQNSDPSEMINSMLPMLKGMGLTFKTSIYGVIGFLIFKLLYGSWGIEKKRIVWVITKSKPQIHARNEKLHRIEEDRHKNLVKVISNLTPILQEEFRSSRDLADKNLKALLKDQKTNSELFNEHFDSFISLFESQGNELSELISSELSEVRSETKKSIQGLVNITEEGSKKTSIVVQKMGEVVQKLGESIDVFGPQMVNTSEEMGKATIKIAESSEELKESIKEFGPMVNNSLESIRTKFVNSIEESSKKMSEEMTSAASQISDGVIKMSKSNSDSHQRLKESLESSDKKIGNITTSILNSSDGLSVVSKMTEKTIYDLGEKISENLKSISTSNVRMSANAKKVDETLNSNTTILKETKNEIVRYLSNLENGITSVADLLSIHNKTILADSEKHNNILSSNMDILNNLKNDLGDSFSNFRDTIIGHLETLVSSNKHLSDRLFEKTNKMQVIKEQSHLGDS